MVVVEGEPFPVHPVSRPVEDGPIGSEKGAVLLDHQASLAAGRRYVSFT